MEVFQLRRNTLVEELAANAGLHPVEDRFKAGYIACINDILDIDVEEVQLDD